MKESITSRINNLRTYMKAHGLAAYIFPSTDPHHSEYLSLIHISEPTRPY